MDRTYTPPQPPAPQGSYIGRHWRGELSLTRTFWLDLVIVGLLSVVLTIELAGVLVEAQLDDATLGGLGLALIGFNFALWIWQVVGLWRSARRHGQFTGVVVPLLIVAVLAQYGYPFLKGFIPAFIDSFNEQYERSSTQ